MKNSKYNLLLFFCTVIAKIDAVIASIDTHIKKMLWVVRLISYLIIFDQ